jgi:hypothetical protein
MVDSCCPSFFKQSVRICSDICGESKLAAFRCRMFSFSSVPTLRCIIALKLSIVLELSTLLPAVFNPLYLLNQENSQ